MDWQMVVTSIASSGAIASGIGYLLKKAFDKTLDLHFKRMSNENKVLIQESMRRQAFIYDKQYEVLKLILSLTYRLRNTVQDLSTQVENMDQESNRKVYRRFLGYNEALAELLYEERAILPELIFQIAHEMKAHFVGIRSNLSFLERRQRDSRMTDELLQKKYDDIKSDYQIIDQLYKLLVQEIQTAIGVYKQGQDA